MGLRTEQKYYVRHTDNDEKTRLIDPAVFYDAYSTANPIDPGYKDRRD